MQKNIAVRADGHHQLFANNEHTMFIAVAYELEDHLFYDDDYLVDLHLSERIVGA